VSHLTPMLPLFLALVLALGAPAQAGTILNTLVPPGDDPPGWSGRFDGLLTASGGNTRKVIADAGGRWQWRGAVSRLRLQVSAGYEESDQSVTARNLVAHLRHNRDLGRRWATVAFGQAQSNPFQRLRSRLLLGAGVRCDLVRSPQGNHVYLGATPMLEAERIEDQEGHVTRGRLSTFLLVTQAISPDARISASGFWQPLLGDLADVRATGNIGLLVDLTGGLDLQVGTALEYNSRPPANVADTDWRTYVGFGVKL
jgi:hypothetical protein